MNYPKIAEQLLKELGGKENISNNAVCMTRLRVSIKDDGLVNIDKIKKIDGVLGIVQQDTLQIVFGPGKVNKVGEEFSKLTGMSLGNVDNDELNQLASENKEKQKAKHDKPLQRFLKHIANIFVPLLPGIIAAGLINGIINIINVSTHNQFTSEWWYQCIATMGWALFAYLPIFVGINACKEFKGSGILGGMAGAMCVMNASMPLLVTNSNGNPIIELPFTNAPFNPAAGGLMAALMAGIFFAYLEKLIRKIMPEILDTFFTPLLTVIIGSILTLLVLQPAGAFLTNGVYAILNFVYEKLGVIGGYILSAGFLPLVSVGLHQALTPIHAMLNDPNGVTHGVNYLLPILMMAGGGQVGAVLAIYIKTKNKKLKKLAKGSIPVGILGVGEPMMYAITLPLGRPFVTACLGAGFGGIFASLFHLGAISQGVSGIFGLLIMQPNQWLLYVIAMLISYIAGFILTWFFGINEKRIEEVYGE